MVVPCLVDSNIINNSNSLKRPSVSFLTSEPKDVKRFCLGRRESTDVAAFYSDSASSSSEDEDEDNSQDESCYLKNQMRARRRASLRQRRSISFVDNKLSRAVSQYSDDDEENVSDNRYVLPTSSASRKNSFRLDSEIQNKLNLNNKGSSLEYSSTLSCGEGSKALIKKSALDLDISARNRCFDYLVSAIDEAWALYCDATSYAEDEVLNKSYSIPATPKTFRSSDNEDDEFDSGYKSTSTNITEYDSDSNDKNSSKPTSSIKLQQLKDRLLKAKYYLQDFLDSDELDEAIAFWRRWDLVKYATVELVEDDDDDEVVENTIEDLEKGRYHACY